jgi:hypothetical protein
MRTLMNLKALSGLPTDQQLTALHKALAFVLAMGPLCIETAGDGAAAAMGAAKSLNGQEYPVPDLKAFEAALATKYATPDQNPVLTDPARKVQAWFHANMPELDLGYLPLFDLVDMRGTGQSQFDIATTSAGITWTQRQPGGKTEIQRAVSETNLPVPVLEFSAGFGLLDRWLQFNQFWKIEEVIAEFIATSFEKKAALHYGLFTAQSTGIDTAFATDDQTTFNAAVAAILRSVRSSGYAAGQNAQLDILVSPEKVGRVLAMLDARRGSPMIAYGTAKQPIAFNVRNVVSTTHVSSSDTGYYVVLPGRKIKRGEWKDRTIESKRDITVSAEDWVGVEQYNAAIGDTAQIRRVKYA